MELEIKDILAILLDKLVLIVTSILICAVSVYFISAFVLDEEFESSATMFISSQKNDTEINALTYNDYNLNLKLVNSYRELCKTERILNKVLDSLETDFTLGQLSKRIEVSSINDTEIIEIKVTDTDPKRATNIANAVAEVFMDEIPNIMKMDNVQLIDAAVEPVDPVKPNVLMNTAIATLLGLMLGVGIAFVSAYFNVTVNQPDQIDHLFDVPILATIPRMAKGE